MKSLASFIPGVKHLLMSGYTLLSVLDENENFIQKPFPMHDLAAQIREILESE